MESKWFVIYSKRLGIYLGKDPEDNPVWSRNWIYCRTPPTHAITFANAQCVERLMSIIAEFEKYELIPVVPDRPDNNASQDACIKAGLPYWTVTPS